MLDKNITLSAIQAQSHTIEGLRMPLMVAVIFIHSFGPAAMPEATGGYALYEGIRIVFSHVLTHCAVPAFFLISGYLFFANVTTFDRATYIQKIRRRVRSLLIPYFLWNSIWLSYPIVRKLLGICFRGKDPAELFALLPALNWHYFWDIHWWGLDHYTLWGWVSAASSPILVPFWFLRDLIIVMLFSPLIYWGLRRFGRFFLGFIIALYLFRLWPGVPGLSSSAFCYFTIGAAIACKGRLLTETFYPHRYLFAGLAFLLFIPEFIFDGSNTLIGLTLYPFFILAWTLSIFCLGTYLEKKKHLAFAQKLAPATFFVYALHTILITQISASLLHHLFPWETPAALIIRYLIAPFLTCTICLFLYYILKRLTPQILRILIGGRQLKKR